MRTLVIDQDSVFVAEEVYGEVFETAVFKAFLAEQEMSLWAVHGGELPVCSRTFYNYMDRGVVFRQALL